MNNTISHTPSEWHSLSGKRIFFGHQSVGYDIVAGIVDLLERNDSLQFEIIKIGKISDLRQAGFGHTTIGKNTDPKSKIDDFTALLQDNLTDSIDVAFMKFCYIDIDRRTSIKKLFHYYQYAITALQNQYPNLILVHFTVPLTVKSTGIKGLLKTCLGYDNNLYRHKYNKLLREHYNSDELFDIADLEATYPDGSECRNFLGVPSLVHAYSYDGRHLNEQGRKYIAGELMNFLTIKCTN